MRAPNRMTPGWVCLILAALIGPGCNQGSGREQRVLPAPDMAPIVILLPIPRQVGDVTIDYILQDGNDDAVDITVEVSPDGGTTFSPATDAGPGAGSEGTAALSAPPQGATHTFVWDSPADIGPGAVRNVQIRITPRTSPVVVGLPATSPNLTIGNDPPAVMLQPMFDSPALVIVPITLIDSTSDPCDVLVEFSTDGGTTFDPNPATIAVGGTTGLAADLVGGRHNLGWNSFADLGPGTFPQVLLRITPSDVFDVGLPSTTNTFRIIGGSAPAAIIEPVPRQDGNVRIDFLCIDPDYDPIDVTIQYSPNGGVTYLPMTIDPASPTTGLASAPIGVAHFVTWQSATDLGPGAARIRVRISPWDPGATGTPYETPDFIVGNDPPGIWVVPIPGIETGWILIEFTVDDSTSDPVDVELRYSTDNWVTEGVPGRVIGLLPDMPTTAVPGTTYWIMWDSLLDLGLGSFNVDLRLTPCDDETGIVECGPPAYTGPFMLNN